uniref:Uncharacterized protein n=1 Tax=Peronospora matthiolae TaxID=2874970 RepID=A0AAV1VGM7_9STRA
MSSENSSSPWNVAPASSPESASPWAVSPFQTSNPFKSPVTSSSSPTETEPEPDTASYAMAEGLPSKKGTTPIFAAAFEPAKEAEKPAAPSSAWTVSPVAEAKETVSRSAWTSAVPVAAEEVKKATSAVVKDVRVPVVEEDAEEVKESIVNKKEDEVEEKAEDDSTGVEALQEVSASAWTTAPVHARAESTPVVIESVSEEVTIVEEDEVSDESLGDSPVAVKSVREAPAPMVDEFVVLHNETADEGTSVATSDGSWTTESVQEEIRSVATEVDTVLKEPGNVTGTVESVVNTAVVALDEEPLYAKKASLEAASAWTVAPVQNKTSEANDCAATPVREEVSPAKVATLVPVVKTPEPIAESSEPIVESCEPVVETSEPIAAASKPMAEVHVAEDAPSTSTWNSAPVQVKVLKEVALAAVDTIEQKFELTDESVKPHAEEVVVETEKETPPSSSAWNAAPAQEQVKAALVEKSTKPVKEAELVQKHVIVDNKPKNVTKATPIAAVKEVVVEAEKETPLSSSAWNATLAQKEMKAAVVEKSMKPAKEAESVQKHVIVDNKPKNVTKATPIAAVKEVVVEAEKETPPSSSAWNAAPAQKEMKAAVVDKPTKPAKEAELVQKHVIVDNEPKNVTKATPVAAVKEAVVTTEAMAEDAKIDKKAIANAFDGVASYEVNSVAKPKKIPMVEAAVSRPADAPGACGTCGGCSIQ